MLALLADFLTESVIKTTWTSCPIFRRHISFLVNYHRTADLIMGVPFIGLLSENDLVLLCFNFICLLKLKSLVARDFKHKVIFWPRTGYLGKRRPGTNC